VDLVLDGYEALNRWDLEWALENFASDVEFRPNPGFADVEPVYRGHQGVTEWKNLWEEAWERLSFRVERIEEHGEHVVVLVVVAGRGRGSGVDVSEERGNLWTIRGGVVVRWESFSGWDEALEAAGLTE
jgi:ketosteroid isomerase-like protein